MRNYGFDYLVGKVQLLSEMARPSTNRPEKNETVVKFLKEIRPLINKELFANKEYPWKVSAPIKTLNDYISEQLYIFINQTAFPYDSVDAYAKKLIANDPTLKADYYDYIQGGSDDSNKRSFWIMSHLLNQNPDLAISKEFFDKVVNRDNIEDYKKSLSERAVGGKKNRAAGYRKHIQQKYNMSADDFAKMKGEVWPIIVKINRKSRQFLPQGMLAQLRNKEAIISDSKSSSLSEEMVPLDVFIETLNSVINDAAITNEYNLDVASLSEIVKILEARLAENKPVSKEKLYEKFINKFPRNFQEYFANEFEADIEAYSGKNFSETMIDDQRKAIEDVLDIYTPDFLKMVQNKGVINEDDIEKILKWKELIKSSENIEQREVSAARKSAGLTGDSGDDGMDDGSVLKALRKYEKEKSLNKKQKPKKAGSENEDDFSNDENEENGVMGYFSEQVEKDKRLNTVGEFKERGFKKPKNYHHWLMIND